MILSDYVELNPRVALPRDSLVPFVSMNVVTPGTRKAYPVQERPATGSGSKFAPGDTLFARITPCLENGKIAQYAGDRPGMGSTEFFVLRARAGISDSGYVYYFAQSHDLRSAAEKSMSGASGRQRAVIASLSEFECDFPPLPIQRRIAGILSAYDELIENSQRRIKILESMARALYREALGASNQAATSRPIVDSPFWRFISENVSNYAGTKRYFATADIEGLAVIGAGIDYSFADKPSRAQKQPIPNSVWFARMKETYKIAWYGPRNDDRVSGVVLSSGFAGFEASDAELWPLLFLTVSSKEFHVQKDLYCTGATQMSLTNEGMARIMLPIPDEESARRLGRDAGPMLDAIASLQSRNYNLRRTRDLLLPRLISGELDVEASAA